MYTLFAQQQSPIPRTLVAKVDQNQEITLMLYLRAETKKEQELNDIQAFLHEHPSKRAYVSNHLHADKKGVAAVKKFAADNDLKVGKVDVHAMTIELIAPIGAMGQAFQVRFATYKTAEDHTHLSYSGQIIMPAIMSSYVLNIGNLHQGYIRGKRSRFGAKEQDGAKNGLLTAEKGFSPTDIEKAYGFPEGDAEGECIGLIELGGTFQQKDINLYCENHKIPVPEIVTIGTIPPSQQSSQAINDLEVTLDIQIATGLAPKAKIVLYYAPSIEDAVHLAINDSKNHPSVLSISWAQSELDVSGSEQQQLNYLALQAAKQGITLVAASGDHGAYNSKSYLNVMSPASHPLVLGCGGTSLTTTNKQEETVWGVPMKNNQFQGSGGGYSRIFPIPFYQKNAVAFYKRSYKPSSDGGRSVPDVSANSAAETAYNIVMNGQSGAWGGGTSASTPVWAALMVRLNKKLGYRLGYINEWLYRMEGSEAFNPVPTGNNGFYVGAYGWSPAAGLGSPNGVALMEKLVELGKE